MKTFLYIGDIWNVLSNPYFQANAYGNRFTWHPLKPSYIWYTKKSIKLVPKNTGNYQSSCTYILYMTMHTVVTTMRLNVKGMISSYTGCHIHCSVLNKELVAGLGGRVIKIIDFWPQCDHNWQWFEPNYQPQLPC